MPFFELMKCSAGIIFANVKKSKSYACTLLAEANSDSNTHRVSNLKFLSINNNESELNILPYYYISIVIIHKDGQLLAESTIH